MLRFFSPLQFNDSYSETKAEGERLVIKANGRSGLLTCCIRPSSIFGPGDKLLVPSLVSAARAGKSKVIFVTLNILHDTCRLLVFMPPPKWKRRRMLPYCFTSQKFMIIICD